MKKKKLKVYVQNPWKISDSPYYKFLSQFPPEGVEYVNLPKSNLIQSKTKKIFYHGLKNLIKKFIRISYPSLPNLHYTKNAKEEYDLLHCSHCISLNNRPWICSMEFAKQFWAAPNYQKQQNRKIILKYLSSNNCKKIIAWTGWVRNEIIKIFPEIENKVEVVYPGIPIQLFKKRKSEKIRLLFVSRSFYFKGGFYAVEIINQLTKKYKNVEGIIVSDVPKDILNKYSDNKNITFLGMIPQKKLFREIYPSADIFVYPSFTDTFGFPLTEALSFGLPIVCVSGQARNEIVTDGETGFVVNSNLGDLVEEKDYTLLTQKRILKDITLKTEKLIKDKNLRKKMSRNCLNEIKKGKFSIKERGKDLERIYRQAL